MSKDAAIQFLTDLDNAGLRITTREQLAAERAQAFQAFEAFYQQRAATCPTCNQVYDNQLDHCPDCGDLDKARNDCPVCSRQIENEGDAVCSRCQCDRCNQEHDDLWASDETRLCAECYEEWTNPPAHIR